MNKTNWKSVILFFLIACLWSWPFFWWRDIHPASWKALDIPRYLKTWSFMWGPGIAALICLFIFRKTHERVMTFKGTSLKHGLAFYLVLPIVIAVVHQDSKFLGLGVLGFISILGEELGWRGFLQDALKMKSDFLKALLMGVLWEIWHFTAHTVNSGAIVRVSIFMVITTVFSLISIELTKKTKSLFIPVALHMALNALFEFERGWQSVLICLPVWIWILMNWNKSLKTQPATTN